MLREQVAKREANDNTCDVVVTAHKEITYRKDPEITYYTLDRNQEYTVVLQENGESNVYGNDGIVLSGDDKQVIGLSGSIIAEVDEDEEITTHSYSDYGVSNTKEEGHAYNGEYVQSNGLIYLRARYYDPTIGNFIQIDNNYAGEAENVATQNRYNYTLNNPYKYVDRDGNLSIGAAIGIGNKDKYGVPIAWYALTQEEFQKKIKNLPLIKQAGALAKYMFNNPYTKTEPKTNNNNVGNTGNNTNNNPNPNPNQTTETKPQAKVECPEEVFTAIPGYYGGNQTAPLIMWNSGNESDKKMIRKIIKKYYPKMNDDQISDYLEKLDHEGCGYVAMANAIFVEYKDKQKSFEKKFGFSFYRNISQGKVCNFEYLIVDLYAATDNHNSGFFPWEGDSINENEDKSNTEGKGTSNSDQNYRFEYFSDLKDLGLEYQYTEGFLGLSNIEASVSNYNKYIKEGNIIISISPVIVYTINEIEYKNVKGGHAMYVTGIRSDKKYFIVSTWGKEMMVKVSDCSKHGYTFSIISKK